MNISRRQTYLFLLVILLLGAMARFIDLGNNSFVADEFLDMNSAYGYFKTGEWQSWDFNQEQPNSENIFQARDERAAPYKWQVATLFKFFPPTEATARSVSAGWGIVTLLLVYWTAFVFTRKREIGLLAAFLYAVSLSALVMDRRLRMYAMFAPVFLAFSAVTFKFLEEEYKGKIQWLRKLWERFGFNFLYLIPVLILGGLSLSLHLLTANIAVIVVAYALMRFLQTCQKNGFIQWNKYAFILTLTAVALLALRFAAPALFALFGQELNFPDNHYGYLGIVFHDYTHALLVALFILFGSWWLIVRQRFMRKGWWLTLSFFGVLFMAIFVWDRNVGSQYIFFAEPFKMILLAAGIYAAAEFFQRNLAAFQTRAFVTTFVLAFVLLPNYSYFFEENNTYYQTSKGDQPNYRKVFGYVKKHYQPGEALITRNFRSYYYSGLHAPVVDFGGEIFKDKLTLEEVEQAVAQNPSGWVVLSENDEVYVDGNAQEYIERSMEKVNNDQVRGAISVYRWKDK